MPKDIDFSRTLVIGCAGSGKTTFAKQFAHKTGMPLTHLDKLLLRENWQTYSTERRDELLFEVLSGDKWLIDGMWLSTLEKRLERATAVIFLDFPRIVCWWGAFSRYLKNNKTQTEDHAKGCIDNFDKDFRHYIWNFNKHYRKIILQMLDSFGKDKVLIFTRRSQLKEFLRKL